MKKRRRLVWIAALLLLPAGCATPPPPPGKPPPASVSAPPSDGLRARIDAILRGAPDARARADAVSRLVFGELRLQETRTCLEIGLACASAGGIAVARTPHHLVLAVPGDGGPLFLDPANPGAILDAEALRRMHPWPANARAERIYGRVLADVCAADIQSERSVSLLEAGRTAEAEVAARSACDAAPDLPEAQCALGLVALRLRRPAGAVAAFDRALDVLPDDPQILYDRGVAAAALGDRDGARRFFEATLRVDPGHAKARADLDAVLSAR